MGLYRRLHNLLHHKALQRDLDRELAFHLAEKTDDLIASGMSPAEARRRAELGFGNYSLQKERTRDMDILTWLESIGQDVRYGGRMIRKSPVFAVVVVLSLAIGIGANATLFSLVDAILLRPLPVQQPGNLVYFNWRARPNWLAAGISGTTNYDPDTKETSSTSLSYEMFRRFREQSRTLSDVFAFAPLYQVTVSTDGQPDLLSGQLVSGNYFSALHVQTSIGRPLTDDDDRQENPVAVISDRYWARRFERSPGAIGRSIVLNGIPLTIIGVTQAEFAGTQGFGTMTDISVPLAFERQMPVFGQLSGLAQPGGWWLRVMGRMKPDANAEKVRSELEPIFLSAAQDGWNATPSDQRQKAQPGLPIPRLRVAPGARGLQDSFNEPSLLLVPLGFISIILLIIVCVNVANLMLARAAVRQSELGVRLAIGGGRSRLVRQLLTEAVLLSLFGGCLGVVAAYWGKDLLIALLPASKVTVYDLRTDLPVLLFTLCISMVTGVVMGIAPALRATGGDINLSLKESSRTLIGPRTRLSKTLLVTQVALSMVLLVSAGMFAETVRNLRDVNVGFNTGNILLFRASPRTLKYSDSRIDAFYSDTLARIAAIPGVTATTLSDYPVVGTSGSTDVLYTEGQASSAAGHSRDVRILRIRPNFFPVLGVPVLAGRNIDDRDGEDSPKVALINEALAHRLFGRDNPIGARVGFGKDRSGDIEIVGIVKDISLRPAREPVPPAIFMPEAQGITGTATFVVRTAGDPGLLSQSIREAVRQIDSNIPLYEMKTQVEQVESGIVLERMFANATTFFGTVALLLACIGLFGLMSYSVERRTNEIGIRMALGAARIDVVRLVMRQTFMLVFSGIIVGFGASYGVGKLLTSLPFIFKAAPNDPLVLGTAMASMIAVASVAAYLPARRASRVDPSIALRCD